MHKSFARSVPFSTCATERMEFRNEVLQGLQATSKHLPCKYFYDEVGSQLFEQICELEEYYLTRTECAIMQEYAQEMAALLGPSCLLIEYGSGSSRKTRLLLDALQDPAGYVPIDISKEQLLHSAASLAQTYPALDILPVCVDYTRPFELPVPKTPAARTVVYFPGSTIGNFEREPARRFLRQVAGVCQDGGLLIGVDLKKDVTLLHHAYNDRQGVTARFNQHLLERINQELGANFPLHSFRHYAFYHPGQGRIEMHLVSVTDQVISIGGVEVAFKRGESIWTERSYKYALDEFARLAAKAGLTVEHVWTDTRTLFSVQYLTTRE